MNARGPTINARGGGVSAGEREVGVCEREAGAREVGGRGANRALTMTISVGKWGRCRRRRRRSSQPAVDEPTILWESIRRASRARERVRACTRASHESRAAHACAPEPEPESKNETEVWMAGPDMCLPPGLPTNPAMPPAVRVQSVVAFGRGLRARSIVFGSAGRGAG